MTLPPVATQNPAQPEPGFSASSTSDLAGELERLMPETPAAGLCSAEARAFHDAGQAWIFSVTRDRLTLGHAFGVVKRGRKRAELFITLIQSAPGGEVFWIGLRNFVARQHITDLVVNCVPQSLNAFELVDIEELALQRSEEAFHRGVVEAVAHA